MDELSKADHYDDPNALQNPVFHNTEDFVSFVFRKHLDPVIEEAKQKQKKEREEEIETETVTL